MDAAKSDLVQVLSSLESHWNVLEAELQEINRDLKHIEECVKKYGSYFQGPLEYLKDLKRSKKQMMKEIIKSMENFRENLEGGKKLVKSLNKQNFVSNATAAPSASSSSGQSFVNVSGLPVDKSASSRR